MPRRARCFPLVVALTLRTSIAAAYRPFDGTDADVAELGRIEIEAGPAGYLRASDVDAYYPGLVLNYGFAPRWEMVAQAWWLAPVGNARGVVPGLREPALFLKTVLRRGSLQGASGPSIATENGLLFPTAVSRQGAGWSSAVIVSQRWRPVAFHFNVQAEFDPAHDVNLFVGLIVEGPEAWVVRPVAELYYAREFSVEPVDTESALIGVIWTVSRALAIDVAARYASTGNGSVEELRAGFSWAIDTRSDPALGEPPGASGAPGVPLNPIARSW